MTLFVRNFCLSIDMVLLLDQKVGLKICLQVMCHKGGDDLHTFRGNFQNGKTNTVE